LTGTGTVSEGTGNCGFGQGFNSALMISGQVTLSQDAYITIEVDGASCGTGGTGWLVDVFCSNGNSHKAIDPDIIKSIGLLEYDANSYDELGVDSKSVQDENTGLVDFNIYPNPASSTVSLEMLKDNLPYNLKVFNVNGRVVLEKKSISDSVFTFNVSQLPKGIYLVDVVSNNTRHVKKLLVN